MTRGFAAAAVAIALGSLAACGGDSDPKPATDTTTQAAPDPTEPDDSTDASETTVGGSTETTVGGSDPSASGGGYCRVEVEGDIEDSWESAGGLSALNMQYWLGEDNPLIGDTFYFILNCEGDGGSALNLLAAGGATEADIPFGPATLTVNPGLSGEGAGPLQQLFLLADSEVVWELEEPGTVEITAFDEEHIAGTFSFKYHDSLAEVLGETDSHVTVTGEFDYENPNP